MAEFLGWNITPRNKDVKLYASEDELIATRNSQVQVIFSQEKQSTEPLLRITTDSVILTVHPESKQITVLPK